MLSSNQAEVPGLRRLVMNWVRPDPNEPPPAKRSPCRAGSPEAAAAYRSSLRGWRWRPLGVHRLHRERVRREAKVEPHLLIDLQLSLLGLRRRPYRLRP